MSKFKVQMKSKAQMTKENEKECTDGILGQTKKFLDSLTTTP
jgi:hypothetical protein